MFNFNYKKNTKKNNTGTLFFFLKKVYAIIPFLRLNMSKNPFGSTIQLLLLFIYLFTYFFNLIFTIISVLQDFNILYLNFLNLINYYNFSFLATEIPISYLPFSENSAEILDNNFLSTTSNSDINENTSLATDNSVAQANTNFPSSGGTETRPIIDRLGYWDNRINRIKIILPNKDSVCLIRKPWDKNFFYKPNLPRNSYFRGRIENTFNDCEWVADNCGEFSFKFLNEDTLVVVLPPEVGGAKLMRAIQ